MEPFLRRGTLHEEQRQQLDAFEIARVVGEAARHYDVPCAFIALESPDGMHFKARYGIDVRFVPHPQDGDCMCRHSLKRHLPIIIEDISAVPRFRSDPLVVGPPFVQFYVGTPLLLSAKCIGTLCIVDTAPRSKFMLSDSDMLATTADRIVDMYRCCQEQAMWTVTVDSLLTIVSSVGEDNIAGSVIEEEDENDLSDDGQLSESSEEAAGLGKVRFRSHLLHEEGTEEVLRAPKTS